MYIIGSSFRQEPTPPDKHKKHFHPHINLPCRGALRGYIPENTECDVLQAFPRLFLMIFSVSFSRKKWAG